MWVIYDVCTTDFEDNDGALEVLDRLREMPAKSRTAVWGAIKRLENKDRKASRRTSAAASHQQRGLRRGAPGASNRTTRRRTAAEKVARAVSRGLAGIKRKIGTVTSRMQTRGVTLHAVCAAVVQGTAAPKEFVLLSDGGMEDMATAGYFATGDGSTVIAADLEASGVDVLLGCCRAAATGTADLTPPTEAGSWYHVGGEPSSVCGVKHAHSAYIPKHSP